MQNPRTRTIVAAIAGIIGGVLLGISANTGVPANVSVLALVVGLVLFIALGVALLRYYQPGYDVATDDEVNIGQWTIWRFWHYARAAAPLYLGLRLYVGYSWLTSGWGKMQNPAWVQTGESLKGFWERSLNTQGEIVYPAYRALIQFMYDNAWYTWMGKVIPLGELLIGLGILLGGLTGFAAFFALLLNFSFLLAGTTSSNPVLIVLELAIILGWRVAGWWGIDHWLLPRLGTPWARGDRATSTEKT